MMGACKTNRQRMMIAVSASVFAVLVFAPLAAEAASPFAALSGSWSGGGRATFEGGQSEKLRCSARYGGGGNALNLSIRCASASNTIALSANLHHSGGRVSGSWSESSNGIGGGASGSSTPSGMRVRFTGGASGTMSISVAKASHHVSVSTAGTTLRRVSMSFSRR